MSKSVEDLVKIALKEAFEKKKSSTPETPLYAHEEEKIEEKTIVEAVCGEGQKFLSDVLGVLSLKVTNNFPVTIFQPEDWDSKISSFIPNINHDYSFDIDKASSVLQAWELGEKVLCYGPTGAGKSSLIEQLCARTGRPFIRVNCTGDMDSSMIFGQLIAKDGSTMWVDGPTTEAVRYGAVFAWDEWDVTPPEISMGLQWLLEDNGKLFLKDMPGSSEDKMIVPHKNFRLVAIGNTQGQGDDTGSHAGTNVQNTATLDRFGSAVYVDYMEPLKEEEMLKKVMSTKKLGHFPFGKLVKLANLIRQGYTANQLNLTFSPRTLFNICNKVAAGVSLQEAFKLVYLNKLNTTQKIVSSELFQKVFGTSV